jgi:hypothetical protein
MMGDSKECLQYAENCRELASRATDLLLKQTYLNLASRWTDLAEEIERARTLRIALAAIGPDGPLRKKLA